MTNGTKITDLIHEAQIAGLGLPRTDLLNRLHAALSTVTAERDAAETARRAAQAKADAYDDLRRRYIDIEQRAIDAEDALAEMKAGRDAAVKDVHTAHTPATGDVIDRAAAPTRQMVTQWRRQRYVMPDDPTPSDKNNATMRHAQSLCVRCKLCGGSAVIEDAGTGYGYSIHCSGAEPYSSKPKCMCTGHRISGDAYNVMLMWNEIHAAPAQEAESLRAEVERLRTERDDAMALFHASDKSKRKVVAERDATLARVAELETHEPVATPERMLADDVLAELTRARTKFPGKNVTFAALVEEVGELATATFEEGSDRVRKEAVQVAVMAMRMVLDGDHAYEPWRAEKGLDPLDPALRRARPPAAQEGRE